MANKINIKPLGDRVLVEPIEQVEKTKSGIIIPDTVSKEKSEQGVVVAVGEGKRDNNGKLVAMSVKKGQKVLFSKYGPDEVKVNGKEYFIISEANILAVIE
jgi:chaperonin GroES